MLKKVPHTYTIVFSIIIICAILTWIIPGGEYARETVDVNGVERTVIVNDSFHEVAKARKRGRCFRPFSTDSRNKPELSLLS